MTEQDREKLRELSERIATAINDLIDGNSVMAINAVIILAVPTPSGPSFSTVHVELGKLEAVKVSREQATKIFTGRMRAPDVDSLKPAPRSPRN